MSPHYLTRSLTSDREFLGLHRGSPQSANLGDGNGWVNEHVELRQRYPILGTLLETLLGGKHFRLVHQLLTRRLSSTFNLHVRVFRQNGPKANSGALFLSSSKEMNLTKHHNIIPDGYNINRWGSLLTSKRLLSAEPVSDAIASAAIGKTSYNGVTYFTRVRDILGLLEPGVKGVNHSKLRSCISLPFIC